MDLKIRPLSKALGAEILGIDLNRNLAKKTIENIRAVWLKYLVIVFPDQILDEDAHTRFCKYFGEIEPPMVSPAQDASHPHVMFISNVRNEGLRTALEDGEMMFHSDRSFHQTPFAASTLYAIEIPSQGGNTRFANCYASYDALPVALKEKLMGRRAMHIYDYENNQVQKTKTNSPDAPRCIQPIFRTHPETGRLAIYVSRLMTDYIVDTNTEESRNLLSELHEFTEQPQFVYEHVWRKGDLVMWDNRCTMHARTHFDPNERRMLRRIAICGDQPF